MAAFLIYIIKSTLALILFYLGYKVLLSRETFFRFNRKVLLGGMIVCLLLPFMKVRTGDPGFIQQTFIELEKVINIEEYADETVVWQTETIEDRIAENKGAEVSFGVFLSLFYLVGIIFVFAFFLRSFIGLLLLIYSGRKIHTPNYVLILTDNVTPPFNWWKYIVMPEEDYKQHAEEIITHELAHYNKRHSWDLVFAQTIILFHWFNPAAWLLKRELQEIHEYQADSEVLKSGIDATKYQLLLVKKAVGSSSYTLANSFNQSRLKKRITMMCQKQSNYRARWKSLLLIPVAACTLYAFARPETNRQLEQLIPSEGTIIPQDNKKYTPEFFEAEYRKYEENNFVFSEDSSSITFDTPTHVTYLLVNRNDDIMYGNEITSFDQLSKKLEATLAEEHTDKKPTFIFLQHDRATSKTAIDRVYKALQDAFIKSEKSLAERGQKAYVSLKNPKNFGHAIWKDDTAHFGKASFTPVKVYVGKENMSFNNAISVDNQTSLYDFRKELQKVKPKEVNLVIFIETPKDTPEEVLSDIKQIINEEYHDKQLMIGEAARLIIDRSDDNKLWKLGEGNQVELTFISMEDGEKKSVSMTVKDGDTTGEIRKQLKRIIPNGEDVQMEIRASEYVPMGIITDLKQLAREIKPISPFKAL